MADAATPAPVYGPRPFHVTDTDQRGVVMAVSILFIVYAFMTATMRVAAKPRNQGIDDWLSLLATVLISLSLNRLLLMQDSF
jgi:hypothetical protein